MDEIIKKLNLIHTDLQVTKKDVCYLRERDDKFDEKFDQLYLLIHGNGASSGIKIQLASLKTKITFIASLLLLSVAAIIRDMLK